MAHEKVENISDLPRWLTAMTDHPSRPTFVDPHVSQFGWRAVSPSRPAISQSVGLSGGQGKRAAARSHAQPPFAASMESTASTGP